MSRIGPLLRRYAFDALIVLAAVEIALEIALRDDPREPTTTRWFAGPAMALLVLPLLLRRRFPFAAPAAVWAVAAVLSFVDGRLVVFSITASVAGMAAAFLLGNLPDDTQARAGLAVVIAGSATVVYNNPDHATGEYIELPGWSEDITGCRSWSDLPEAAREYLDFIADFLGLPIVLVGVGPGRDQIIWTEAGDRLNAAAA